MQQSLERASYVRTNLVPKVPFGVAIIDPPWAFENWTDVKHGASRTAYGGHAEVMEDNEIVALAFPISSLMAKNCVVGIWSPWSKSDAAWRLFFALAEFGLKFKTGIPYVKTVPREDVIARLLAQSRFEELKEKASVSCGIGFWSRSASECFWILARGSTGVQSTGVKNNVGLLTSSQDDWLSGDTAQFWAPRGRRHSEKPVGLHAWFEKFNLGPRLEIFGRQRRPGWTVVGHDLGLHFGPNGIERIGL